VTPQPTNSNEMENKKYELWSSESENSDSFFPAENDSARDLLAPDAKLIHVIEANSWNEAQQKRYDFMGWGHYKTFEEEAE
jgi:hypothetical protein